MSTQNSDWYSAEVYVRGTNLLAKFSKQSGNVKTDYQYYTQNAHGDVVNLTDAQGAITKSYTYDAFGVEKNIDDADTNSFRYCGEYYDAETGTIYLRARYYNPSTGRFISRDSYAGKSSDPLSLNRYTYCYNNPIYYSDPSGNFPWLALAVVAGCALLTGCKSIDQDASISTSTDKNGTTSQVITSTGTTSRATTTTTATVESKKSPTGISLKGIELLKQYESFEPRAYLLDGEDYYIIGYGHQIYEGGTSVEIDGRSYDTLTEELATTLFMNDINDVFAPTLNKFLSDNDIVLTQNQYDALIADSFQKGQNIWFDDSYSITAYIKAGDFSDYDTCLAAFIGDSGDDEYTQGRINRRTSEAKYFFGG